MTNYNTIKCPNCFSISSGNTNLLTDVLSINNCIGLLLRTSKGELLGDPMFGTNLIKYIYEPNDFILADQVSEEITEALSKYEPRIIITQQDIKVSSNDNAVNISLSYYIKKTGEIGEFQFSLLKEEYNE